jgi:hypothetical protein
MSHVVEYAKSKRSTCKTCKESIDKDEIRIGLSSEDRTQWYHLDCWKIPKKVKDVNEVSGFDTLKKKDQKKVEEYLEDSENKVGSAKWKKISTTKTTKSKKVDKKTQKVASNLKSYTNHELKKFLTLNDQKISGTKAELCVRVADGMLYGVLPKCPKCGAGTLKHEDGIFSCPGFFQDTHFKRCSYKFDENGDGPEPEEGKAKRTEWQQFGTEKDDAIKGVENVSEEEEEEEEVKEKPKKRKRNSEDEEEEPKKKKTVVKRKPKKKQETDSEEE